MRQGVCELCLFVLLTTGVNVHAATLQATLDEAEAGAVIDVTPAKYAEDVVIRKPNITIRAANGTEVRGTIRVEAPGVSLLNLTVVDDERCVVVGPAAQGFNAYANRLVISTPTGVAMEVAGTDTAGMQLVENQFYNVGGVNPDTDHRGYRYNWKPFERAGTGLHVRGTYTGQGEPLRIHHNRISGYQIGLLIEAGEQPLKAWIWKNRITANTTGLRLLAAGCRVEENEVLRNTASGLESSGRDNVIAANRIMDNAGWGLEMAHGQVRNNVIARNREGGIRAAGACAVVHNTFHGNGGALLSAGEGAKIDFANNLADHAGILFEGPGTARRRHNVYANGAAPAATEPGSRAGAVKYRNLPADDFRPLPDSLAVDAGVPVVAPQRDADYAGRTIGSAPDAGAFEVGPEQVEGREWWVSPAGDDETGDGSETKPFKTVSRAARDAGPDHRIFLQAGVYEGDQTITCAGAKGHPVRILPAPGVACARRIVTRFEAKKPLEMATPPGGRVSVVGSSWTIADSPYLVIEGLEFRESPHAVIRVGARSSHSEIRDCVFINCPTHTPEGRSWHAGIVGQGPESSDVLIENNIFDRRPNRDWLYQESDVIHPAAAGWNKRWIIRGNKMAGYDKMQLGWGPGGPHLTYLSYAGPSTYHLVEDNEFFECNRAVHIKTSDNIFRHNYIHDLVPGYTREPVGIMNRSGARNVYDGNRVVDCSYAGVLMLSLDNTVVNNVFENCETGVLVAIRNFSATPGQRTRVYHNTFVNSIRAVQVDATCSAIIFNNLIYNAPDFQERLPTAPTIAADGSGVYPTGEKLDWHLMGRFQMSEPGTILACGYNLFWNCEPGYLRDYEGGQGDLYADPLFVDSANGDYRLRRESPARGAGRSLYISHDFDRRPRPLDSPDLGAFQFQGP